MQFSTADDVCHEVSTVCDAKNNTALSASGTCSCKRNDQLIQFLGLLEIKVLSITES